MELKKSGGSPLTLYWNYYNFILQFSNGQCNQIVSVWLKQGMNRTGLKRKLQKSVDIDISCVGSGLVTVNMSCTCMKCTVYILYMDHVDRASHWSGDPVCTSSVVTTTHVNTEEHWEYGTGDSYVYSWHLNHTALTTAHLPCVCAGKFLIFL